jgi:hypothetical protein
MHTGVIIISSKIGRKMKRSKCEGGLLQGHTRIHKHTHARAAKHSVSDTRTYTHK